MIIGGRSDPEARYLHPTIVYPVSWNDSIMEDEVFGPILPILTYRTLDEAFGGIAATPHPLAAFIFSREQKTTASISFPQYGQHCALHEQISH